jgi:rod shape-determining protein MreD
VDFLVIAVLLSAVRVRPGVAALIGFCTGLVADSLTPSAFGAGALAMTAVGASASWLKAVFFADNVVLHGFFFFVGKWAFDIVYVTAERRMHGVELATQLLLWSPLSAAATAVAGHPASDVAAGARAAGSMSFILTRFNGAAALQGSSSSARSRFGGGVLPDADPRACRVHAAVRDEPAA